VRAPPAAVWRVAPDRRWQAVGACLSAMATASVGVWLLQRLLHDHAGAALEGQGSNGLLVWCVFFVVSACTAAALWGWRAGAQPAGLLLWNGHQWRFQAHGAPGAVDGEVLIDLMLDSGGWMLLRLRPARVDAPHTGKPQWLSVQGPVEQHRGEVTQWVAFRAAVYFRALPDHGALAPQPFPLNDRRGL
jgi:hypothetical protein